MTQNCIGRHLSKARDYGCHGMVKAINHKKHQADLHNTPWLTDLDNRYKTAIFLLRYCSLRRLTINKAHKEPVSYLWVRKVLAND